jgi:hypothetical protein
MVERLRAFRAALEQMYEIFKEEELDRALHICRRAQWSGDINDIGVLLLPGAIQGGVRLLAQGIKEPLAVSSPGQAFLTIKEQEQAAIEQGKLARERQNARRRQRRKDARELDELRRHKAAREAQHVRSPGPKPNGEAPNNA